VLTPIRGRSAPSIAAVYQKTRESIRAKSLNTLHYRSDSVELLQPTRNRLAACHSQHFDHSPTVAAAYTRGTATAPCRRKSNIADMATAERREF
jgi:hypothetical protein